MWNDRSIQRLRALNLTPFPQRGEDFLDLYDVVPALDLLVYTPQEFALLTENPTLGFWKSVAGTLKRFL